MARVWPFYEGQFKASFYGDVMIDLCVVHYNTPSLLERLLENCHSDYSRNIWTMYLADNGSGHETDAWIDENLYKYNVHKYFKNENIGYSAACNQLASIGSGEIIGLLNADIWFSTKDIIAIQEAFDANSDMHILGPKQRDQDGYITHAGIVGSNIKPVMRGWKKYDPDDLLYKDVVECVTVSGSAYFIRRDTWNSMTYHPKYQNLVSGAIGAFLPTPHYYEETWCSYFARHLGYNILYNGNISIGHDWHKSSRIGGEADQKFKISQKIFRDACDYFEIERD